MTPKCDPLESILVASSFLLLVVNALVTSSDALVVAKAHFAQVDFGSLRVTHSRAGIDDTVVALLCRVNATAAHVLEMLHRCSLVTTSVAGENNR